MYFDIVASGSKGNATLVITKESKILIDMGISFKCLEDELNKLNIDFNDIDAALFTHNHSDHINGIKFLSPKKMFALEGTLPGDLSNVIYINKPFNIKDVEIMAFQTSHDAINPCGYILSSEGEKLVYMTDTGIFLEDSLEALKNPNYLIIESNHDIKMLLHTNRTYELKSRIMSDKGHLCNEDSALASLKIIGPNTKEIILAHLSEEANTPELALSAYEKIFKYFNYPMNKISIRCANQRIPLLGGNFNEN